jgi:hypothetical protein
LLGAAILGIQILHILYLLHQVVPEETTYIPASTARYVSGLLIATSPVALYLCCLIFAKKVAISPFGKIVCLVQLLYVGLLITDWLYARSLTRTHQGHTHMRRILSTASPMQQVQQH